jgi:hypothetical protein
MLLIILDENLNKLQTSVDNLRKAFQKEIREQDNKTVQNKVSPTNFERLDELKRKYSALKIQTWYRNVNNSRMNDNREEIEK